MSNTLSKLKELRPRESPLCATCDYWPVRPRHGRLPGRPVNAQPAEAVCIGCGYSENYCTCEPAKEEAA